MSGQVSVSQEQFAVLDSGVRICHQSFGDVNDPALLLIMGLGGPMGWWDDAFCTALAERGFFVIRYDNRDAGRSTKMDHHGARRSNVVRAALRLPVDVAYGIDDLAGDAFGLLDHLGRESAHVVGISMGGMIGQTMAIARPERVASLTSIMSTTGRRTIGWQSPRLLPRLLRGTGSTRDHYIEGAVTMAAIIGSPAHPPDPAASRLRAEATYDRGWTAAGVLRQMIAVLTQRDRTHDLRSLTLPVTVIHGDADRMIHRSGGAATAAAVPAAVHVRIPGMGHDLPPPLWARCIDAIADNAARA